MTNIVHAPIAPLYASKAFLVESIPERDAAELTSFGDDNASGTISSVMFTGMDAAMFLTGFSDALTHLSDAEVEEQYLNQYGPLMQSRYLQ